MSAFGWLRPCATLLVLALVAGCGSPDGYRYERSEFDRRAVEVEFVAHRSATELRDAARRMGVAVEADRKLQAFALVDPVRPRCTMHVVDPARDYRPEWIGHEVVHCWRGRWHP